MDDLFSKFEQTIKKAIEREKQIADKKSNPAVEKKPVAPILKDSVKAKKEGDYNAESIEVLEGLEPVRKRPGMYIGGTDENALHHLLKEVFDNSMDEAVAGHATRIELELHEDMSITVSDNGRGIPVDPHPKYPNKSALEVILTTLHSGGKFSSKAYETSGGLHGVGISVVNALSKSMRVEVYRNKQSYSQDFSRGKPTTELKDNGAMPNKRGTKILFKPDVEIFGADFKFKAEKIYQFAKSKAYLYRGVEIRWLCPQSMIKEGSDTPVKETIHFPEGLKSFIESELGNRALVVDNFYIGQGKFSDEKGKLEWAISWCVDSDAFIRSYCNTIPTPLGGTHEQGLRLALLKSVKQYADVVGVKKGEQLIAEDVMGSCFAVLSVFIKEPQFQGQTKDKLVNKDVNKWVEGFIKDNFDHWLTGDKQNADKLLAYFIRRADERLAKKKKDVSRKSPATRLRLPGKLTDCTNQDSQETELFLVEGDSAGGSAKQARDRATQAILPLRGKILNVANATADKILANQEIKDMEMALGCGMGSKYSGKDLRYGKIIIMTDADVDGAHIASLLMTFFYLQMPQLVRDGHLYLAVPPLFRINIGKEIYYARDEQHKDEILAKYAKGNKKVDIGRFKGLGEMMASQLKETAMHKQNRTLLQVNIADFEESDVADLVSRLMGKNPEHRMKFITQESLALIDKVELDV